MPNVAGEPRLFEDGVARTLADLACMKSTIRRMITVCQHTDGSISYIRESTDPADNDVLVYIGMLDFAKMGFFSQMQAASLEEVEGLDKNGIGDTSWVENGAD